MILRILFFTISHASEDSAVYGRDIESLISLSILIILIFTPVRIHSATSSESEGISVVLSVGTSAISAIILTDSGVLIN